MISIIIPTYNEKENICRLIPSILAVSRNAKMQTEIVIIDDDSPDNTARAIMERFGKDKQVRVFVRKGERGLAGAILYGIGKSRGDTIVGMDADFNHPPEHVPLLVQKLAHGDLVIASRFIKGGGMEEWGRYIGTLLFNVLLKRILGFPTMDNMSGFYAIRKDALTRLGIKTIYEGYGDYHLRLVWHAKNERYRIVEIPVFYKKRMYGNSKSHLLSLFFSYLLCAIKLRLKKNTVAIV